MMDTGNAEVIERYGSEIEVELKKAANKKRELSGGDRDRFRKLASLAASTDTWHAPEGAEWALGDLCRTGRFDGPSVRLPAPVCTMQYVQMQRIGPWEEVRTSLGTEAREGWETRKHFVIVADLREPAVRREFMPFLLPSIRGLELSGDGWNGLLVIPIDDVRGVEGHGKEKWGISHFGMWLNLGGEVVIGKEVTGVGLGPLEPLVISELGLMAISVLEERGADWRRHAANDCLAESLAAFQLAESSADQWVIDETAARHPVLRVLASEGRHGVS